MAIILKGSNVFHDGWLAGAFSVARTAPPSLTAMEAESWELGYDMAVETGDHRCVLALHPMIAAGQCIVVEAREEKRDGE